MHKYINPCFVRNFLRNKFTTSCERERKREINIGPWRMRVALLLRDTPCFLSSFPDGYRVNVKRARTFGGLPLYDQCGKPSAISQKLFHISYNFYQGLAFSLQFRALSFCYTHFNPLRKYFNERCLLHGQPIIISYDPRPPGLGILYFVGCYRFTDFGKGLWKGF